MKKKRLLVFHPTIALYRVDFFNRLCDSFETRICLQFWNLKEQKFDYDKIYEKFCFKPVYLPANSIKFISEICNQISSFDPDIVLTPEYGRITLISILMRLKCKKHFRIVVMTDDSYDMVVSNRDFSYRHRFSRALLTKLIDEVVLASPQITQWYQNKFNKGVFFPIIVDNIQAENNYKRLLPLSRKYIEDYHLKGKKVLLSVSRLVDIKNIDRVIEAYAHSNVADTVLIIVGDGIERQKLENLAKSINKDIIFAGRFEGDELYAWYNLASVFVLASYVEPFGAVTNEALLAGCRVIVSEKAGSSCLVSNKNGEIVDPFNIMGITAAIDNQFVLAQIPDLLRSRSSLMEVSFDELYMKLIDSLNRL